MRIGIFGGSFDPIHYGHLILAEHCLHQASLDEVWFIPAATAPHKERGATMTDRQRTETIKMAIGGHPQFVFSDIEIKRGGISYTVDTLSEIKEQRPEDELLLLIGKDSLDGFNTWKEPRRICELAVPVVVSRPSSGDGKPDLTLLEKYVSPERFQLFQQHTVQSPLIEISSSEIRRRFESGESSRYLLPRGVEKYIETAGIYQAKARATNA
ncbi:MAG: nicotinate-nucleotide adenylyltransferase [Planctomycetota bacterium]